MYTKNLAFKVTFYVRRRGGGEHTCFSLIKDLNKINNVNTMYMYFLNFTAYL